ncbi:MAG: DUF429 domain-containing protein [Chloroflexi bacterium]|nr:DUF429 domain-containing protein [Chloroflexota bacterium]
MAGSRFTLAGVDGCGNKWVAALAATDLNQYQVETFKGLGQLLDKFPTLEVVAVDTPIGLPDVRHPLRQCDLEARALLGRRGGAVFPAPQRLLLESPDYTSANLLSRKTLGKGLSPFAYGIFYYLRDADATVRQVGQRRIKEVHPEVSFWAMNERRAMGEGKKKAGGLEDRCALLIRQFGTETVRTCEFARIGKGVEKHDLYDALAALWSARRILEGNSKRLPENTEKDAEGLLMEINY